MKAIIGVMAISAIFVLCGCPGFNESPNVGSPNGSVPNGSKIYSPDGKYFAKEIEPYGSGQFGVFDKAKKEQVWTWDALPDIYYGNALKGMAWSEDSSRVAIMYHGGAVSGTGVYVYELFKEKMVASASAGYYYHFIIFDSDGLGVWLANKGWLDSVLVPLVEAPVE